eukprot:2969583-Prorocentrum_lima.AAC.1
MTGYNQAEWGTHRWAAASRSWSPPDRHRCRDCVGKPPRGSPPYRGSLSVPATLGCGVQRGAIGL